MTAPLKHDGAGGSSAGDIYANGMARIAAASPRMKPADPAVNAQEILRLAEKAHAKHAALILFPELTLSAYAIDDLLMQDALLVAVEKAAARLIEESRRLAPLLIVGAPVAADGALYNSALLIHQGRLLAVIPKTYLPNYREFYEKRHFASGGDSFAETIKYAGQEAPFGSSVVIVADDLPDFSVHVEICEDLWAAIPPSTFGAFAGANILCNLSASNALIGKAEERNLLANAQSRKCAAAYLYAGAGPGESTTDLAWDGHLSVWELGEKLAESERHEQAAQLVFADIDLDRIRLERLRTPTFRDNAARFRTHLSRFRRIGFSLGALLKADAPLERNISRFPYVPNDRARLDEDCREAYNIQVHGLTTRLKAANIEKAVIGVSGGLDSTQALLVTAKAVDRLGLPRKNIVAVTMPGFATSDLTRSSALALMRELGVDARELDITPAATQMLADIKHPFAAGEKLYDVTFENVQAGLRTDYLFRIANHEGGLVIGTGDLSELALGWCTYGVGDHMSHYNVNASIPKTLIQHLIRWCAVSADYSPAAKETLNKILGTEISPELVPDTGGGPQRTEDMIGPYELADFALFYTLRYGLKPSKIYFLMRQAWEDAACGSWPANIPDAAKRSYDPETLRKWLRVFLYRFFAISQFKRSAAPNGPKVSSGGSLSPRGEWRAPSDASAQAWLDELDAELGPVSGSVKKAT